MYAVKVSRKTGTWHRTGKAHLVERERKTWGTMSTWCDRTFMTNDGWVTVEGVPEGIDVCQRCLTTYEWNKPGIEAASSPRDAEP